MYNVANGQARNNRRNPPSRREKQRRITISKRITKLFMKTPIAIEKPTNPSRYSFFHGFQNVRDNTPSERSFERAPFNELKYLIRFVGASIYQNLMQSILSLNTADIYHHCIKDILDIIQSLKPTLFILAIKLSK